MQYRILYCENCGKEYPMSLERYGENCEDCGIPLSTAWKVEDKEFSCVKFIDKIDNKKINAKVK